MQRLEVSSAVRSIYGSLCVKQLRNKYILRCTVSKILKSDTKRSCRMVTYRTLNQFEIRTELFYAVSIEGKCFFKAFTNRIRQEPVKRGAEILKQQVLMTISLKYPFFAQQDTFVFLVKIAEVHNNSHIKKFQSNFLI